MKFLILILAFNFYVTASAKGFSTCHNFLNDTATDQNEMSTTDRFFSYLKKLYQENVIDKNALQNLKNQLERNQLELNNPIVDATTSAYDIHKQNVASYLISTELNHKELIEKLSVFLKETENIKSKKLEAQNTTQTHFHPMQFHPIKKGSYKKYIGPDIEKITLTHSFLMMDSFVTQKMWAQVMKQAITIEEKSIHLSPDTPINAVSWISAMEFANKLSIKEGLKPAYLIEKIADDHYKVKVNSASGSIYDTEGYRLPTTAEQEFVRTQRGAVTTKEFFPGLNEENFMEYAWCAENSSNQPQPVGTKSSLMIDGKAFYDLFGNLYEMSHNIYDSEEDLELVDPQGPAEHPRSKMEVDRRRMTYGKSFDNSFIHMTPANDLLWTGMETRGSASYGFRLVRSLPK